MKNLKYLLIVSFILCMSAKCMNDEKQQLPKSVSISGQIIEKQTKNPIDSVKIILGRTTGSFLYSDVAYFYSDSLGMYNVVFSPILESYSLEFYKKN
jgi:hypothetical protein